MFGLLCWALDDEGALCSLVIEVEALLEDLCNFSSPSLPPYYLLKQGFTTKTTFQTLETTIYYFNIHYTWFFRAEE